MLNVLGDALKIIMVFNSSYDTFLLMVNISKTKQEPSHKDADT